MKKQIRQSTGIFSIFRRGKCRCAGKRKKDPIGSALIVTLIILSIILISALSISITTIRDRKAAISSAKSNTAFQNADIGIEKIMNDIWNFDNSIYTVIQLTTSAPQKYTAELSKFSGGITVPVDSAGTDRVADIARIKCVGSGSDNQRAVEAAVVCRPFPKADPVDTVALYHLEDAGISAPSVIKDSSSSENDGQVVGTVDQAGGICTGRQFDGDPLNYISVPDTAPSHPLQLTGDMTVEAWVKWNGGGVTNTWRRIVGKGDGSNRNYGLWMCSGACLGVGQGWLFQVYDAAAVQCNANWGPVAPDQNWHYLVGVFNAGNRHISLYLDGSLASEVDCSATFTNPPVTSNDPLTIGYANGIPTSNAFDGIIDEVRISNTIKFINAGQVNAEYLKRQKYMP